LFLFNDHGDGLAAKMRPGNDYTRVPVTLEAASQAFAALDAVVMSATDLVALEPFLVFPDDPGSTQLHDESGSTQLQKAA
jgi:hypothetical protein